MYFVDNSVFLGITFVFCVDNFDYAEDNFYAHIYSALGRGLNFLIFWNFYEGTVTATTRPDPQPPVLALMVRGPSINISL